MCLGEGREGCCGQRSWQRIKGRQDLFWIVAQRTVDKCFGIVAKNELILQGGEEFTVAEDGTGGGGVGRTDCPESEGNKDHRKQGERHCSGTRKLGRAGSFSTESDGNDHQSQS
jgi:hypothetical protein